MKSFRIALLLAASASLCHAATPTLRINAAKVVANVSPVLYGLMTEEINFSYEGGLYGELIRNRAFKADPTNAVFWSTVGPAAISLDFATPLNEALNVSLKLDATHASKDSPAGIANGGYWGIAVRPKTTYRLSFYAKAADGFSGPLIASIQSADGKTVFATAKIPRLTSEWQKYEATLKTKNVPPSKNNQFTLATDSPGTIWLQQVSLFPPTWHNRPNGNRPDIMQLLADMHPKFLRLPGGNYLEGDYINTRFDWKKTIGDTSQRPGHESPWRYWSTDGLGLLEYCEWCEDLHMEPLLAVYAGYSLRHDYIKPGPDLEPYVQDALDEIEYIAGDTATKWGGQRAKDGHLSAFPLHYIEVGNEDEFDRSGSYDGRFTQFYDAIKAKYPQLQVIATAKVKSRVPDFFDEHLYPDSEGAMESRAHEFDDRPRTGPKTFVGEWATRVGTPTPNMAGALGDAAWMCNMERNSDIVFLESYAPLFVNVSDLARGGSMQWRSDLIGYDALTSYGSPSYYAQQMFSTHHGDAVLATDTRDIPTYTWQPPRGRARNGVQPPMPSPREVPSLFFDATRDSRSGTIFVKVVNHNSAPQPVAIEITGVTSVKPKGEALVLKADSPSDTNSIEEPKKIIPVMEKVKDLAAAFTREFPPYSITILELKAK
ncbi:MAG TPA: alpha-L-arabinofuranosidase C-terminal domain-containing protein [Verrucomicrobiae bacterium]|nr:alpha-L-arabinofuranosidase C-terminal domain-containing protein [Verrucomicrobiae bacterium]